jgi:membrane protein
MVKTIAHRCSDNALGDRAAYLAWYFLFAMFPALFFVVTLAAYLPIKGPLDQLLGHMREMMPPQAMSVVERQLASLAVHRPHYLWFGLLLALWSSSRGVNALRGSLNRSFQVKESRPFWRTQGLAIVLTIFSGLTMMLAMSAITLGGDLETWLARQIHIGEFWTKLWDWVRYPLTAMAVMFVLAVLYHFLPDVQQKFRFISPGSLIGTLLWLVASYGFSIYVQHFGSYDKTYGSIGGVMILMTWLYLTAVVFILGGEINAVLAREAPESKAIPAQRGAKPLLRSWRKANA